MAVEGLTKRMGRAAMAIATGGFMVGVAFLNAGSAQSIGGLCNGQPASSTWLDASGQYGPAILDGTHHDDTIIGSDGDDVIDGRGGDDFICGAGGNDSIAGGSGHDGAMTS
jgi:Ca2+-binding RTX toxin-like protein